MPVRAHADWLSQTDERILELLADAAPLSPVEIRAGLAAVSPALDASEHTVRDRCEHLRERDLLVACEDGVALTAAGRGFLDGDVALAGDDGSREGEYWLCPDCRWTGRVTDRDADCPVCGNDAEYVD